MGISKQGTTECLDARLNLIGNSWQVGVVSWLIAQLAVLLGLIPPVGVQDIIDRLTPGKKETLQGLLLRPGLHKRSPVLHPGRAVGQRASRTSVSPGAGLTCAEHF